MASKYLNVLVGGVNTPINIDEVVTIVATGNAGDVATTVVMTYKNLKTLTLTTPADDNGFAVATGSDVERSLWEAIIAASSQPWNMVMYPSPSKAFGWTLSPATSQASDYAAQNAPPADTVFAAKQSAGVLAKDGGPIVWSTVTIA